MFAITVTVEVRPGKEDEFVEAITRQAEQSRRTESGCLRFDVLQSRDDPRRYVLHEIYADEEAHKVGHRQTAHYKEWSEMADDLLVGERMVAAFDPLRVELSA